jgi:hypothetical protein
MSRILITIAALSLLLSACGDSNAPQGRWQGFQSSPSWIIAVRMEMQPDNRMKASALSANVDGASLPRRFELEGELQTAVRAQWNAAQISQMEYVGNTVTRKKGYAPVFVYEPRSQKMIFHFYAGGKLAETVALSPVKTFSR